MSDQIFEIATKYLELDRNPRTSAEIKLLVEARDTHRLRALLGSRMTFGTAGLRAEMGAGYTRMNELTIIQATQGLCMYLFKHDAHRGVVIGHDHRNNSDVFARLTAAVFLSKNIKVFYYHRLVHTPMVPFGVKTLGAACGIMITASHNPKNDNGYKVYWDNACQITPPHDEEIASSILNNLVPWTWDVKLVDSHLLSSDPYDDLVDRYFEMIASLRRTNSLNSRESTLSFCYTAMHGVGHEYAVRAFKAFRLNPFIPVVEQIQPDPEFPTVAFPNPEEGKAKGALKLAMATATANGCKIILANDPDADRLAIAEIQKEYLNYVTTEAELGIFFQEMRLDQY